MYLNFVLSENKERCLVPFGTSLEYIDEVRMGVVLHILSVHLQDDVSFLQLHAARVVHDQFNNWTIGRFTCTMEWSDIVKPNKTKTTIKQTNLGKKSQLKNNTNSMCIRLVFFILRTHIILHNRSACGYYLHRSTR